MANSLSRILRCKNRWTGKMETGKGSSKKAHSQQVKLKRASLCRAHSCTFADWLSASTQCLSILNSVSDLLPARASIGTISWSAIVSRDKSEITGRISIKRPGQAVRAFLQPQCNMVYFSSIIFFICVFPLNSSREK